jgi:hypothetical protein
MRSGVLLHAAWWRFGEIYRGETEREVWGSYRREQESNQEGIEEGGGNLVGAVSGMISARGRRR